MKKFTQFSLTVFAFMMLAVAGHAQFNGPIVIGGGGPPGCFDKSQVCPSCNCLMVYDPVCGCNGQTYSNACFAYIAGITSWGEGACGSFSSVDEPQEQKLVFRSGDEQMVLIQILDAEGNVIDTPFKGSIEAGVEYLIEPDLDAGTYTCQVTTPNEVLGQTFTVN